ncbi:Sec17 protein [Starmerella bacillaris]|uniref:Sec17 protein n=1 Tax=Starmerella bacillaris TaxID=1247836 RepID=A0AAV5RDS8_STABA|nr:Sec17 protein [Starmerella bacillaris]
MDPQELIKQAEKKVSSSGGLFSRMLGSSSFQLEDAADLYMQAGNAYRLKKDSLQAGKAFEKAADLQKKSEAKDEAANTLVEAYKAYRTSEFADAARTLNEAIHMFTLRGQFRRAAQYQMDLAQLYETELNDGKAALQAYQSAGDWFNEDRAEALSCKAYIKYAELSGLEGEYHQAIEAFEKVAKLSMNSNLSKWSLKDYFFKAVFCALALQDAVAAQMQLDKYISWDSSFEATKEYEYLSAFVSAARDGDEQTFTDKLYEYDKFAKLDNWKTTIGLRIKQGMDVPEDDLLL